MDGKEEREMIRILPPGNNRGRTEGFILLDALLSIFIAGILLIIIYGASSLHRRISAGAARNTSAIIEERNGFERDRMKGHE